MVDVNIGNITVHMDRGGISITSNQPGSAECRIDAKNLPVLQGVIACRVQANNRLDTGTRREKACEQPISIDPTNPKLPTPLQAFVVIDSKPIAAQVSRIGHDQLALAPNSALRDAIGAMVDVILSYDRHVAVLYAEVVSVDDSETLLNVVRHEHEDSETGKGEFADLFHALQQTGPLSSEKKRWHTPKLAKYGSRPPTDM